MATKKSIFINEAGLAGSICGNITATTFQLVSGATDGYVLTSDADGNASWQEGASNTYTANSPATCTVGGISPGYVLTGKTLECILQDAIAPYIEPTFSAFNVGITPQPFEVGTEFSGTKSFTWGTTTSANVASGSVGIRKIAGSDAGVLVGSGFNASDSPQSLSICTITDSTPTIHTWQVTGCSTQDNSFSRNVSKCSVYPYFWGVTTSGSRPLVTNDLVTGGTKVVSAVSNNVGITFNSSNQYTWYAQPAGCADRTKWFIAVGNCGFVDRGVSEDRYPDKCTLDISSPDGCWSNVSYEVYMSDFSDTLSDTLYFRTY